MNGSDTSQSGGRSLLIRNARLVDRDMDVRGSILVRDGRISAVYPGTVPELEGPCECVDARGAVLMPAFIDLHAHFRDPGFTAKEDLASGSRAAAAGGYGTVVLMANTNPVISDAKAAEAVRLRAGMIGLVDVFQSVSLTRNFDGVDTAALAELDPSVVPVATEDGREVASSAVMLDAMKKCATRGIVVSCHCEDPDLAIAAKPYRASALKGETVRENLASAERLLRLAEDTMTFRNLELAAASGCRIHIAHVSTSGALESVRRAKSFRPEFAVSCEVTPHHLSLTDITPEIVNPPLRSEADREALIAGLIDGTVDAIATDHAPHTAVDKAAGAPGFSGIQTAFAVCNTVLVQPGLITLSRLSALMSANPARILGLERGLLRSGYDADLILVDPEANFTVTPEDPDLWFSRGKNTPFAGKQLVGLILETFRNGCPVYPVKK